MNEAKIERKTPRFGAEVRIFFTAGVVEGEGVVLDVSKGGCRVQCETEVTVGMEIEARLYFPDYDWPMKIERAAVRWVTGDIFGVEFLDMLPAQQARLRSLLAGRKPGAH